VASYVASAAGGGSAAGAGADEPPGIRMTATAVRRLQHDLHRLGYFDGPFTGYYGPLTKAAVARFQKATGLAADGLWGPHSQAALVRRLG